MSFGTDSAEINVAPLSIEYVTGKEPKMVSNPALKISIVIVSVADNEHEL